MKGNYRFYGIEFYLFSFHRLFFQVLFQGGKEDRRYDE